MLFIGNVFSFNMIKIPNVVLDINELTLNEVKMMVPEAVCVVRRRNMKNILSGMLDFELKPNRESITLKVGDKFIYANHSGTRIPNDATELPEGAKIDWLFIRIRGSFR